MNRLKTLFVVGILILGTLYSAEKVTVKVFSLPNQASNNPQGIAELKVVEKFKELHPEIELVVGTSINIEGRSIDAAPLMAIAGGTSPDIIYVNFRKSSTYLLQGFLYPLDEYVEQLTPQEVQDFIPQAVLPAIHREGPDGKIHYWAMPYQTAAIVLQYRRDLFAAAGLNPEHPPRNWKEFMEVARKVSDPSKGIYGFSLSANRQSAWKFFSFLSSAGARAVEQLPNGDWKASFDNDNAVTAYDFVNQLQKETVTKNGKTGPLTYRGSDEREKWIDGKVAMTFDYLGNGQMGDFNPDLIGVAAAPEGPEGKSSAEVNALMMGIFAGQKDKKVRDAAWTYIHFLNSHEARKIYVDTMVEQGAYRMLNPQWLREFGYAPLAQLSPKGLSEAFEFALQHGTPEPYGKNCQFVYDYLGTPIDEIYFDPRIDSASEPEKREIIRGYLTKAVANANEKMIGNISEAKRSTHNAVAWVVAIAVAISFYVFFKNIFSSVSGGRTRVFEKEKDPYKNHYATLLIAPAMVLILAWQYYPLLRGSLMAFQNYSVMGNSPWVGINNFADILFEEKFWRSLWNAFYFCALWLLLGFLPPVMLAVFLQEIPKGKILFRLLFYMPAAVTGVVILFMWRAIYDPTPDGILNSLLAFFHLNPQRWLQDPALAMICVVFPMAWAHFGPGSIIYLAALKGIPDELFEASEIDGASFWNKLRYIVFPYLKPLLVINLVGATIHGFQSGSAVLAMTGGGPNGATDVVGFEIFERSFMFLQFGHGTAMAWVVGVILLVFTAYQLKILNKVEFRTNNR